MVVAAVSVLAAIFAREVIVVVAPGFEAERVLLATELMRLVLLQTVIASLSGIVMSVLQAHQHFLLPAAAPLAYTLGRIGGALFLAPHLGIHGLALGGLAGTMGHFLIQVPGLVRYKARWTPTLRHPDFGAVLRLMGPRMLGLSVTYVNFVLPTYFGSRLATGAIASYEYGWRLMQFPETIIGTALGLTVFPTLSQQANAGDRKGLRATSAWALRLVLALAIPAAVGLVVLGRPLTALFLQRGAFDAEVTDRVYRGLQAFALGLVAHSALEVSSRLFYAQRDMWTPLWTAAAGLATNLAVSWLLLARLEHVGLALANSLGAGVQVLLLQAVSAWRLRDVAPDAAGAGASGSFAGSLARTLLVSALMGIAVVGFRELLPDARLLIAATGGIAVGGGTFLIAALLFGSPELRELPGLLGRRE
jgi:putative peptidoglycan lipid II flippase